MVSFEDFRPADGVPIYLQILTYIKRGAIAGTIHDGDELPSRRVLSALTMLELDGYVAQSGGKRFSIQVELKE